MRVIEIFDSIDGEGIRTGLPVSFIRLAGCNLRCSYCDTVYSLYGESEPVQYETLSPSEIVQKVNPNFHRITLTGGEPLIHEDADKLVQLLLDQNYEVNIETNGAVSLADFSSKLTNTDKLFYTVDYKLPSSGMSDKMIWENFLHLNKNDVVKLVVGSQEDLKTAEMVVSKINAQYKTDAPHIFMGSVYEAFSYSSLVAEILSNPVFQNVRFQIQLHKVVWNPELRGV